MERIATTPGLYPLPEDAKDTLADLKGHQKEDLISGDESPAVDAAYQSAREYAVTVQREAGLDRVVEGQLRWDDMLAHPLCVHDNVRTAGIVRYYDNNNFYRRPVIEGPLEADGDLASELGAAESLLGEGDTLQGVLPGPYTLLQLARDEHYGDPSTALAAIGEFLAGELRSAPATDPLFLLEPSLVTDPPKDEHTAAASEAIDTVATASEGHVVVHTYWAPPDEHTYAHLLDADIDGIGIDLVTPSAREPSLEVIAEYGAPQEVALGVVDGQNTEVESPSTVRERVQWFEDRLPATTSFDRAYVTSNTELFYLPISRFEAKLDSLAAAARAVKA